MRRLSVALAAILLLNSCALPPVPDLPERMLAAARSRAQTVLALQLQRHLGERIPQIISLLAQPGGYLNHPLVRILLPPPLGFALAVALDLATAPQTPPLQILLNRAAELAIPGAGPILTETLRQFTVDEVVRLFTGGETAATESLRQRSYQLVVNVVEAKVASELAQSGAGQLYQELKDAYDAQQALLVPPLEVSLENPQKALEQHVTTAAVDGLFRLLGEEEEALRNQLADPEIYLPSIPGLSDSEDE
ncbi:MAG: DUF4197 domain-containing protein [Trichloromonadaceae bacterium]